MNPRLRISGGVLCLALLAGCFSGPAEAPAPESAAKSTAAAAPAPTETPRPAPWPTAAPTPAPAQAAAAPASAPGAFDADFLAVDAIVPINDRNYAPAVLRLLLSARKSLRVCLYQARYYYDYPGSDSNQLVDALILARERGVRVEVIMDQSSFKRGHDEENMPTAERLARGGCLVYFDPPEVQSHQKILIADGAVTVVASANWSHYSMALNREASVMIWGADVAQAYTQYFEARLEAATPFAPPPAEEGAPAQKPLALETVPPADLDPDRAAVIRAEELARALNLPVAQDARLLLMNNRDYYPGHHRALAAANRSVDLVQAYAYYYFEAPQRPIAPSPDLRPAGVPSLVNLLFDDLVAARRRGVAVRAVFDFSVREDGEARYAAEDFANRLAALGVDAYRDYPFEQIHAKMALIDDRLIVIGSTNWSYDAVELNNECAVLIESPELGAYYRQWVDSVFARSVKITEPGAFQVTPLPTSAAPASRAEEKD